MAPVDGVQVMTGKEPEWPQAAQETDVVMLPAPGGAAGRDVPAQAMTPQVPARAQRLTDGSYRLPLFYPVTLKIGHPDGTVRDEIFDALILKRLKGKQMRLLQGATLEQMPVKMLQASTGLDDFRIDRLYDEMDNADIRLARQVVNFFIKGGQETGL